MAVIIGNGWNNVLVGTSSDDVILGLGGDDFLIGGGGSDYLDGGDGKDLLAGGLGADVLDGGTGIDTASYASESHGVEVDLAAGKGDIGFYTDTLLRIENVVGSSYNDALRGDAGVNELWGGSGNDTLEGGAGADKLDGGEGFEDFASYRGASAGVTASLATGKGSAGDAAGDTYVGVEGLLGSKFGDVLRGDESINKIYDGEGTDQIFGNGGTDLLYGDGGNDRLVGGTGFDILEGGRGADVLEGGLDAPDLFVFRDVKDSLPGSGQRDVIADFQQISGEVIDLHEIDAKAGTSYFNEAFTFIGTAAFSQEGQVRYAHSGGNTIVQVNTGGASGAEMEIQLHGQFTLNADDFSL